MRVAIVEDEPLAAARLEQVVLACAPDVVVVARLTGVRDTAEWLDRHGLPDLMFLDIRLRDGLALDLVESRTLTCPVIFTTAHDDYVMRTFAANTLEYLLKPVDPARVARALEKYRQIRTHFSQQESGPAGDVVTAGGMTQESWRRRFVVRKGAEFVTVATGQVAYFCTEHKMTFLVDLDGSRYLLDDPLAVVETQVDPAHFFRANRQYIVSVDAIDRFRPGGRGQVLLDLRQLAGTVITVSQERAAEFRRWIDR